MPDLSTFRNSLNLYLDRFPEERARQDQLLSLLDHGKDVFDRRNMVGHVTASALVFDSTEQHVLLVHHRGLNRLIQPGGHVDATDPDLVEAAKREVGEETGVTGARLHPWHTGRPFPFSIGTHKIPARPEKGEGEHWHHDVLYLLIAPENCAISPQLEEVWEARWFPRDRLVASRVPSLSQLRDKLLREGWSFEREQV